MEYPFQEIEAKWQAYWEKHKTFKAEARFDLPKFYALDMFPYPSGSGLHVGHPEGYTATDIVSRYKRMKGFNVLHPMGWDSFGLPAENYAIKTGTHPEITTQKNIATFRRQLKMLGFSYDWDREVTTSSEDYYRWTQWIFTQLYNKGLAYEAELPVNWCPELKCVLANEEVIDGKSAIGEHPVVRKPMKQWMLRITDYADRLLEDLEGLDWSENIKEMQRNWIGRSEGASVTFSTLNSKHTIEVYTTRPDTLFGATFMVLAPEHSLVRELTTEERQEEVEAYCDMAARKSDRERIDQSKAKTGVFIGSYAINPINQKEIPIYIADYVLNTYGSGAIMAVPAHDQRDWEFAKTYNISMVPVLKGGNIKKEAFVGDGKHINSGFLNGLGKQEAIDKAIEWLTENRCGKSQVNYKLRDWIFSRQRYWGEPFPVLKFEDGSIRCLEEDELPVTLPAVNKYEPSGTGESPLATIDGWLWVHDPKTGKRARRETHTMPQWAGSCWYYLRFLDPQNQEQAWSEGAEKYWMPVDLYVGGVEHAVLHLLYARFWHKVLYDLGYVSTKEPFQKLVNQGLILGLDGEKMSKARGNVVNPDEVVTHSGADSLRLYEMFMGPLEKQKPWSETGVTGVYNFLKRVWAFFEEEQRIDNAEDDAEQLSLLHKIIKKVGSDIEEMKFNTAISSMMTFMNQCYKKGRLSSASAEKFVLLLSPFAPHLAEELWERLGHQETLAYESFPSYNEEYLKEDRVEYPVQFNGKLRFTLSFSVDALPQEIEENVLNNEKSQKWLRDKEVKKVIIVPQKVINIVCR